MKSFVITGSVTYAIMGKDLLNNNNIYAKIKRQPSNNRRGCGYGIITTKQGVELLKANGIKILDIEELVQNDISR